MDDTIYLSDDERNVLDAAHAYAFALKAFKDKGAGYEHINSYSDAMDKLLAVSAALAEKSDAIRIILNIDNEEDG